MEATPNAINDGKRLSVSEMPTGRISIFPNPVTNELHLESNLEGEIQIINSQGQILLSGSAVKGLNRYNLSSLATGVYFVILRNDENKFTKKLLKL